MNIVKSKNELEKIQPYQLPHIQQTQSTLYKKQLFESNEVLSSNYTEININCCLRATKACKAFDLEWYIELLALLASEKGNLYFAGCINFGVSQDCAMWWRKLPFDGSL